jgi:hypothetical protein
MRPAMALIAVLLLGSVAVPQEAVNKEMAQLEGEWSMVSGEANGQQSQLAEAGW